MESKRHFAILDGLRGVAALAVVIFHFMEWVFTDPSLNFIGHGFLAVDFFFCLSGFVIAYAYDHRIKNMGLGRFFRARLILEVQSLVNHCDAFTPHVGNRVTLFCLSIYSFQGLKLKQNKKERERVT